jgi:hypothetical protein
MQNEPNFKKTKMDLNICSERHYEKKHPSRLCENEPKTNPIFELGPQPEQLRLMSCVYGLASAEALAYNSAPIREHKRLLRAISRAIRDNSRQLALIRDKPPPAHTAPPLQTERCTLSAEHCNFAKQTQFAKMRNKPKPMSIKDL